MGRWGLNSVRNSVPWRDKFRTNLKRKGTNDVQSPKIAHNKSADIQRMGGIPRGRKLVEHILFNTFVRCLLGFKIQLPAPVNWGFRILGFELGALGAGVSALTSRPTRVLGQLQASEKGVEGLNSAWEGTFARRARGPPGAPRIQINVPPSIPMLYPCRTALGVPFSQLQKHKSFVHDWKKWWRGSVMTRLTFLGIIACSLGHSNQCPNPIVLGYVGKSHTDTCPQTVGGGMVTVETLPGAPGALTFPLGTHPRRSTDGCCGRTKCWSSTTAHEGPRQRSSARADGQRVYLAAALAVDGVALLPMHRFGLRHFERPQSVRRRDRGPDRRKIAAQLEEHQVPDVPHFRDGGQQIEEQPGMHHVHSLVPLLQHCEAHRDNGGVCEMAGYWATGG